MEFNECYTYAMSDFPPSQQKELQARFAKRGLTMTESTERGLEITKQLHDAYNRKRDRARLTSQAARDLVLSRVEDKLLIATPPAPTESEIIIPSNESEIIIPSNEPENIIEEVLPDVVEEVLPDVVEEVMVEEELPPIPERTQLIRSTNSLSQMNFAQQKKVVLYRQRTISEMFY
jgi:hypothetical protein